MYDLKELKKAANDACRQANVFENRTEFKEAVNWGDLKCISAKYCVDDIGDESYEVIISEADPNCLKFKVFVYKVLCNSGFPDVSVITEW